VDLTSTLDDPTIAAADAFVFVNYEGDLDRRTLARVRQRVAEGAGLLVVGDHTFLRGARNPMNDLLADTGIRFGFDTGVFCVGGWRHSYRSLSRTLCGEALPGLNDFALVTGASLKVEAPARPLVVGRYGFVDAGKEGATERALLGDMEYTRGEQLGDIVLVAGARYANGIVVAVADTSPYTNTLSPLSHRFLLWTVAAVTGRLSAVQVLGTAEGLKAVVWLLVTGAVLWVSCSSRALAIAVVAALATVCLSRGDSSWYGTFRPGTVGIVDRRVLPNASVDPGGRSGLGALHKAMARLDLVPLEIWSGSEATLSRAGLCCVVAPRSPVEGQILETLLDYAHNGGTVLVSAGWDSRRYIRALMDATGLEILPTPLGPLSVKVKEDVGPVCFRLGHELQLKSQVWHPLVSSGQSTLVAERSWGRGRLVWIADDRFLWNENLESGNTYIPGNVALLSHIVSKR
jgi:hypothetical protein